VLAIGSVAMISLLIYSRAIAEYRDACAIVRFDVGPADIGARLGDAVAGGNTPLLLLWASLLSCAVVGLIARAVRERRTGLATPSLDLYLFTVVAVASPAGVVLFMTHGLFPQPWHYIPFLAVAALAIEVSLRPRRDGDRAARLRVIVSALIVAVSITPLWRMAHLRRTNLDRLSSLLESRAAPGDLILVNPFWLAPGFKYHYHGRTEWNTLPLTSSDLETSIFPFASIKQVMATPGAIQPTLQKIEATLSRGNRLWIIGLPEFPNPDPELLDLAPAPKSRYGWNSVVYGMAWERQVGAFLAGRVSSTRLVPIELRQPVHPLENPPLLVVEGWRR